MSAATLIFESITSQLSSPQRTLSGDALAFQRNVVRLAALTHDIGHCVFSHVSEKFYERQSEVAQTVGEISDWYGKQVTASECLSLLIINSPTFFKLLERSGLSLPAGTNLAEFIRLVSAAVAGADLAAYPDGYLVQIVNGPADCDKLDYIARDAHMAGVPISLDIDRLVSKLRLVRLSTTLKGADSEMVQRHSRQRPSQSGGSERYALAIVPSAARAMEELLVSRIFLYDKFYFHPKVMAAEELLRVGLDLLSSEIPDLSDPAVLLEFGDDQFLRFDEEYLAHRFKVHYTRRAKLKQALEPIRSIRDRVLPKRCFALASRFLPKYSTIHSLIESSCASDSEAIGTVEYKQLSKNLDGPRRVEFERRIREAASELGVNSHILIGHQIAKRVTGNIALPVLLEDGTVDLKPSFLFEGSTWTEAFAANKATSYVYCQSDSQKDRALVHIAAEATFARHGLYFSPNASRTAKVSETELQKARSTLRHQWRRYSRAPHSLSHETTREKIRTLSGKFSPVLSKIEANIRPHILDAWISQFDPGLDREVALDLLDYFTMVEETALRTFFAEVSTAHPTDAAVWIPLIPSTGPAKSTDAIRHSLKNTPLHLYANHASVESEHLANASTIVLFDDALFNGVQATSLMASWLGEKNHIVNKNDADTNTVKPELAQALRTKRVVLAVYGAHSRGVSRIRRTFRAMNISTLEVVNQINLADKKYSLRGFQGYSKDRKGFIGKMEIQGKSLMRAVGKTEVDAQSHALGYGQLGATILFPHSVPSAVPTCMWLENLQDTPTAWIPAFPRKGTSKLEQILRPWLDRNKAAVSPTER